MNRARFEESDCGWDQGRRSVCGDLDNSAGDGDHALEEGGSPPEGGLYYGYDDNPAECCASQSTSVLPEYTWFSGKSCPCLSTGIVRPSRHL